jgi:hypothetical protein
LDGCERFVGGREIGVYLRQKPLVGRVREYTKNH